METPLLLLNQFTESMQKQDEKAAAKYRQEILQLELNSEAAVIAKYRLGFYVLSQEKKLDEALAILKEVASCNIECDDFFQAQITYAICLWSKDKQAQAIFELRKMLSRVKPNTVHEILALDYLSIFLRDTKAPAKEITQINTQRINSLSHLLQTEKDIETQSAYRLELAAALEERNQPGDLQQARIIAKKVVDTAKISKSTSASARSLLKHLNLTKSK